MEPCSIHSQIKAGAIHVDADNLRAWLSHFKVATENVPVLPPSSLSTATSPWLKSPFSAVSIRADLTRWRADIVKSSVTSDVRGQVITKRSKRHTKVCIVAFLSGQIITERCSSLSNLLQPSALIWILSQYHRRLVATSMMSFSGQRLALANTAMQW